MKTRLWPFVHHAARRRGIAARDAAPEPALVHPHHVLWCHARGGGWYRCGAERIAPLRPHLGVLAAGETDQSCLRGAYDLRFAVVETPLLSPGTGGRVRLELDGAAIERPHIRELRPTELATVARRFAELQDALAMPSLRGRLQAGAIVAELLSTWASEAPSHGASRSLALFRALIEQHAEDADLTLAELACRAGGHPDHLASGFRRDTGCTPVAFRMRLRLDRARALLLDTPLGVAEVARRVGFRDRVHFTRCFRRLVGCAPSDYALWSASRWRPGSRA